MTTETTTTPRATFLVERVEQVPAYRKVYEALEHLIYSRELKPGALLPTENDLADRFGLTRSTVREGIRLLEQRGLVERVSPKRLVVSRPNLGGIGAQVSRALLMHEVTFSELWETLIALEPMTAALAARRATPELVAALEGNIAAMKESAGDLEAFIALDVEFHDIVGQAASNRALLLAHESVSLLIERAGAAILPKLRTYGRVIDIHVAVVDAIRNGDAEEAGRHMKRHMVDFRRGYELAGFHPHERLIEGREQK
jgi:GntR family transcriptional repressor for pyruvate dehydrogenase complex